ncbi:hypothetical protein [Gimesia maris]|uniref:Uncharacterized protein n=1 Tax=Gimesia maris TaxID=122 RepID=A0A3D3RAP0_9PLAN|nr:hypothetical protein [Gimesia sp.]HCO25152.1 hypothetical protein [Gimesia maris]|tara:strand:- start:42791 stop:43687 length:897 start_codon:yes stop_codon:yes gene_type:complete
MKHLIMPVQPFLFLMLCATTSFTGCTSLALSHWGLKKDHQYATAKKPAIEIVALWEPAEGKGVDGMPTRGFAGQLLFFQHNNTSPVYVKGEVYVNLYDDQGNATEQKNPIHQYKFDSGAWQVHAVESTLGPAYQVFIPYVRKGRDQAECALRVQLTQKDAPEIFSRMISVKLDGKTPQATQESVAQTPAKQPEKIKVEVDTLARRESGKSLELSPEHKLRKLKRDLEDSSQIQQVGAQTATPVVDERDERIHRLEQQLGELLNQQNRSTQASYQTISPQPSSEQPIRYQQFRLNSTEQ